MKSCVSILIINITAACLLSIVLIMFYFDNMAAMILAIPVSLVIALTVLTNIVVFLVYPLLDQSPRPLRSDDHK